MPRELKYFEYDHLPERLQKVSKPFHDLAHQLCVPGVVSDRNELEVAIRKLLEAKDAAVRAAV